MFQKKDLKENEYFFYRLLNNLKNEYSYVCSSTYVLFK